MKWSPPKIAELCGAISRRRHFVALALVVGWLSGVGYYFLTPRSYVAQSQLLFMPARQRSSSAASPQATQPQSLATYQSLLHSTLVLDLAQNRIQELPPEGRADFGDQRRDAWAAVLASSLSSRVLSDDAILEVSFSSRSPDAAPLVVGAITGALADCLKRQHKEVSTEILATLQQERLGVEQRLLAKRQQLATNLAAARTATSDIEKRLLEIDLERLTVKHQALASHILDVEVQQNHPPVRLEIISPAVENQQAAWPQLTWVMLIASGIGLAIGLVASLWWELADDRFRRPEEVRQCLGVPLLATIGRLPNSEGHGLSALPAFAAPHASENEPLRMLRDLLTYGPRPSRVSAVTSVEPGDGKTTVLANLGVAFAQAGKRTLLIDADLRRRGLTQLFQLRAATGLSSVLSASTEVAAVGDDIQSLGVANLDLLCAGPRPMLPGELLGGPRMAEVLAWAKAHYDQVLIDLPPLAGQVDAAIVGRLAECVVLVLQPEVNQRTSVVRAQQQLRDLGVQLAGVVANRVAPGGAFGQRDAYAYRYAEIASGDDHDAALRDESWPAASTMSTTSAEPTSSPDEIRPRRVA